MIPLSVDRYVSFEKVTLMFLFKVSFFSIRQILLKQESMKKHVFHSNTFVNYEKYFLLIVKKDFEKKIAINHIDSINKYQMLIQSNPTLIN
jgi:hypothetical protein